MEVLLLLEMRYCWVRCAADALGTAVAPASRGEL
jgi:hypothetical protein